MLLAKLRLELEGHTDSVTAAEVTPDGRRALSASEDRTLRIWDLENGQTLRTLEGHTRRVNFVGVTVDGRRAVSASADQTLRLWDLENGKEIAISPPMGEYPAVLSCQMGGRLLPPMRRAKCISCGSSKPVKLSFCPRSKSSC
jgi:WD40 repeat protein